METQRQKSIKWWNSLGKTKRTDLSSFYFGTDLLMDDEIESIFLKEIPPEKLYSKGEIFALISAYNNANIDSPNMLKFIQENL